MPHVKDWWKPYTNGDGGGTVFLEIVLRDWWQMTTPMIEVPGERTPPIFGGGLDEFLPGFAQAFVCGHV